MSASARSTGPSRRARSTAVWRSRTSRPDVSLETVNGTITADFDTLGADQRVDAEAVNGRIELILPADASARVNAETVNGSIDADDFGLEPEKGFVGRDLSGEIGGGDARISLDTVNGSVKIRKK
jgi:DUF4097 and DUF4098 domain-containing protein YvlB